MNDRIDSAKVTNRSFSIYYLTFTIIVITMYIISYTSDNDYSELYNFEGILIFCLSLYILICSIDSIRKRGINACNLFFGVFYLCLMVNTFNISLLQQPKTLIDLYFYFTGPLLFGLFLHIGEKANRLRNIKLKFPSILDTRVTAAILLFAYYALSVYTFFTVGIKLFHSQSLGYNRAVNDNLFVIPGISGIVNTLFYCLLIYSSHVKRGYRYVIIISIFTISGLLDFSRGNIMRIFIFIFVGYAYSQRERLVTRRNIRRAIISILVILAAFVILGNFRQHSNSFYFNINTYLLGKTNNEFINWIFGYVALSFDTLKLTIAEPPTKTLSALMMTIHRLFGNYPKVVEYLEVFRNRNLGSTFNSSTFLSPFISDMGVYYFIEVIIVGIVYGMLISICKTYRLKGVYYYILVLIVLTVFGNYLVNYQYTLPLIIILPLLCSKSNPIQIALPEFIYNLVLRVSSR